MSRKLPDYLDWKSLYNSDFYSVNDFSYECGAHFRFEPGYTQEFCISFTRKGFLTFNSFRQSHQECNTRILIEKPGCEFTLHHRGGGSGCGTSFRFSHEAYAALKQKQEPSLFFRNPDIFSLLLSATPEVEYLYYTILQSLSLGICSKLEIDGLVIDMLDTIMNLVGEEKERAEMPGKLIHLSTVERAKEYIMENFMTDISLFELARNCFVSPFHFSRIFKLFSGYSPYQYLQLVRLKHAETLIKNTDLPMTDVCFRSGFNRLDYFSAAFTKKYNIAPSRYKQLAG